MTSGFEVFVHEVIAAITTWPLSTLVELPSDRVTDTGSEIHGTSSCLTVRSIGASLSPTLPNAIGSLAGKDSADASSSPVSSSGAFEPSVRIALMTLRALRSGMRSCGRLGPAMEGSTVARSSSSVCE